MENDALWYKDAIIYEAHVRAFYDSTDDGIGDFEGFRQKLDYLQDLGINCIWLLPFYPSPLRDDGYDISVYRGINPNYGTMRDFRRFVKEAHRRGIRIINELVINHTSDEHRWFRAARIAPPGSPKRDFYVWSDTVHKYQDARIIFTDSEKSNWTWDPVAQAYYWHRFFYHQPDLNYDNPAVLEEVLRVLRFWLDFGVDGLRLDAVPYLVEREGTNCENLPETHEILRKIRKAIDGSYENKMILAEANQWPSDVRPYFGDGDECHMAFHFPLMPRIFMALRQEDRHPITEIMRQTPEIPSICQWGLFLRNHDELTLEMVADEERDYMYRAYAADPRMRINIGIRRRLAPLMDNSRRRIELLNSLLLSFHGTPIIYYGDELGMGDNIYLGDRNGVRTPMQWSGDRNAGFSRADFAKLYSPPIMDPVYGYQSINVEAQQRDPSSLLNWMKRIISLRNRFSKLFGRGTFEFLYPSNRKVLAYTRKYQDDSVLCVANLSRFVQPVELDLSSYLGLTPVEMIGGTEFPKIKEHPYFLTLGPHSFYWFHLVKATEPIALRKARVTVEQIQSVPLIVLKGKWDSLLRGDSIKKLEQGALRQFIPRQRWFGSKTREIRALRVDDVVVLPSERKLLAIFFVRLTFSPGEEVYIVPLTIITGEQSDKLWRTSPDCIVARIKSEGLDGLLYDAMRDDSSSLAILRFLEQQERLQSKSSTFAGTLLSELQETPVAEWQIERIEGEQTNSSVIFNHRWILKLFRRLEDGQNPDYEVLRFLHQNSSFRQIPPLIGALEYQTEKNPVSTVAVLQKIVNNQGDAWEHSQDDLVRYMDRVRRLPEPIDPAPTTLFEMIEVPGEVIEVIGAYLEDALMLGTRTAELHLALASATENEPAFVPEPMQNADFTQLARTLKSHGSRALKTLRDRVTGMKPDLRNASEILLKKSDWLLKQFSQLEEIQTPLVKTRIHGDYHLGQVLWVENDFVILDFEGEPARPIAERRLKQSPLKDVAGMLRSFSYAAYSALNQRGEEAQHLRSWIKWWYAASASVFLNAYLARAAGAPFVPQDPQELRLLLGSFLLDKALYEVEYELNHRPEWVGIPISGILDLINHRDIEIQTS